MMRILRPVVQVAALSMFNVRHDCPLGRSVAFQLIGHHDPRHIPQTLQQLLEEALGRLGVAPALHQHIENHAVLIDRAPEIVLNAPDLMNTSSKCQRSPGFGRRRRSRLAKA
jgi:hypothetical protein